MSKFVESMGRELAEDTLSEEFTLPQLGQNGSSKQELMDQYMKIFRALQAALEIIVEALPEGRDYQRDSSKLQAARKEHYARYNAVAKVAQEYYEMASAIKKLQG